MLVPNGLIVVHVGGAPLASAAWPSGDSTELTTLQGMKGRSPLPGASAPDRNRPCEVDRQQRQPEGDEAERYGDLEQREDEAQRGEESKHAQ